MMMDRDDRFFRKNPGPLVGGVSRGHQCRGRTLYKGVGSALVIGMALLAISAATAGSVWAAKSEPVVFDRIAAIVNDEIITLGDLQKSVNAILESLPPESDPKKAEARRQQFLKEALEELVSEVLILNEADRLQVQVSKEEIDGFITGVRNQYGWDEDRLNEVIRAQGTTMKDYRDDIRKRLRSSRLVQIRVGSKVNIGDEVVEQAFKRQYGADAVDTEISASHILVMVSPDASDEDKAEAAKRIEGARERVLGGEDFGEVAKDVSEDPSAPRGGHLGTFQRGLLEPSFEEAAFAAEPGELVGPITTPFGYHLIMVTDRKAVAVGDTTQLKERLREQLHQETMQRQLDIWLAELRQKGFVDIRL